MVRNPSEIEKSLTEAILRVYNDGSNDIGAIITDLDKGTYKTAGSLWQRVARYFTEENACKTTLVTYGRRCRDLYHKHKLHVDILLRTRHHDGSNDVHDDKDEQAEKIRGEESLDYSAAAEADERSTKKDSIPPNPEEGHKQGIKAELPSTIAHESCYEDFPYSPGLRRDYAETAESAILSPTSRSSPGVASKHSDTVTVDSDFGIVKLEYCVV